nr:MAG TPA: hypothetical protein [Caudoviricetes sp.]
MSRPTTEKIKKTKNSISQLCNPPKIFQKHKKASCKAKTVLY